MPSKTVVQLIFAQNYRN